MSMIGQLCLWIGFLGGALATVFRLEVEDSPWSTIPWGPYMASIVVGTIGVVMLRHERSQQRKSATDSDDQIDSVAAHLESARDSVTMLRDSLAELTCEEVLSHIDARCVISMTEFAEGREAILNHFGASVFAEVMTEFASGERYLNRAWSAAADGYVDEVEGSVEAAKVFLDAAVARLSHARSGAVASS